jgi:hypothetical protein
MTPRKLECLRINDKLPDQALDDIQHFPLKIIEVDRWYNFCKDIANRKLKLGELMLIDFNFKDDNSGPWIPLPGRDDPAKHNTFFGDSYLGELQWSNTLLGPPFIGPNSGLLIALHFISGADYRDLPCGIGFHTYHPKMVLRDMTSAMIVTQLLLATGVPLSLASLRDTMRGAVMRVDEQSGKNEVVALFDAVALFREEFLRRAGTADVVRDSGPVRLWMEPASLRLLLDIFQSATHEDHLNERLTKIGIEFYDRDGKLDCLDVRSVFLDLLYRLDKRGIPRVFQTLRLEDVRPSDEYNEAGVIWAYIQRLASRSPSNIGPVLQFLREYRAQRKHQTSINRAVKRAEHRLLALIFSWLFEYGERWVNSSRLSWDPFTDEFDGDFPPMTTQIAEFVKIVELCGQGLGGSEYAPLFSSTSSSIARNVGKHCEGGSLLREPLRYGVSSAVYREHREAALKLMAEVATRWGCLEEERTSPDDGVRRYRAKNRRTPTRRPMNITQKDLARVLGFTADDDADPSNELKRIIRGVPGFELYSVEQFLSALEERSLPEHLRQLALEFVDEFWNFGSGSNIPPSAWPNCILERDSLRTEFEWSDPKKRLRQSLHAAVRMQTRIVPPLFEDQCGGLEIWCRQRVAEEVGGDYYRIRRKSDRGFRICLGDVVGHGWSAALITQEIHGLILALESQSLSPDQLCAELDRKLRDSETRQDQVLNDFVGDRWATFVCADLDSSSGTLIYSSAAHPNLLLIRKDGSVESLGSQAAAVGMQLGIPYRRDQVALMAGDRILFFTDGIVERGERLVSEAEVIQIVLENRTRTAREIGLAILSRLDSGAGDHTDDATLIVVSVTL